MPFLVYWNKNDEMEGGRIVMLETADKKPTHHLSKGLVIGLVAPVVTVALLIKHHREKNVK